MRVPEKSPSTVAEAPPRDPAEVAVPSVFQRTFQYPRVVLFIVVMIGYVLSLALLFVAAIGLSDDELVAVAAVLGLFGFIALAASVKGSWGLAKGPRVYLITLEPEEIIWGIVGDEQRLDVSEIASIHYAVDTDSESANDLTLASKTHAGERLPVRKISLLVPRKVRPKLLAFLRAHYTDIKLSISE